MQLRFHKDPDTGQPHIYGHGVSEEEVREIMAKPGRDYPGARDARMRLGQTDAGRHLLVIYVPDEGSDSAFVITARELKGKALKAYRRRQRRKPR
jgi:hypothetical protein